MSKRMFKKLLLSSSLVLPLSVNATTYTVQDVHPDTHAASFGVNISETGRVLISASGRFRPIIDMTLIDFENETIAALFEDVETVKGVTDSNLLSEEDYLILYSYVSGQQSSVSGQKISTSDNLLADEVIGGFDVINANTAELTSSTVESVYGVNQENWVVGTGSAPYLPLEHQFEDADGDNQTLVYQLREFSERAFINVNGTTVSIASPELRLGGLSRAFDINNQGMVVGVAATGISETAETAIESCETDEEVRGNNPVEYCLSLVSPGYTISGYSWQLADDGSLIEDQSQPWGLAIEPEEEHQAAFGSSPLAVNDNNIAVGYASNYYKNEREAQRITRYAAIFQDDQVTSFTDNNEYTGSVANDINNDNMVVGYIRTTINGFARTKFFTYDMGSEQFTLPEDFFPGSSSVAKAINNSGLVVGDGEINADLNTTRRKHGFIYSIEERSFTDLNQLLGCDSPYTIVEANGINDAGEIAATALVNKVARDLLGNPLLNEDGSERMQEQAVAVKLLPSSAEPPNCSEQQEQLVERKGASLLWMTPFLFLLVFATRRKR